MPSRAVVRSDKYNQLTPAMRHGAFLDAQGKFTPKQIAEIVGVHEKTVSGWRGWTGYLEERDRWVGAQLEIFAERELLALSEWWQVIDLTRNRLLELLIAEKLPGIPDTRTQLEALKVVAGYPATKRLLGLTDAAGASGQGVNQTVTLIVHRDGDVETVEIVEGEAEEVSEDGDRKEEEDDRSEAGAASSNDAQADA